MYDLNQLQRHALTQVPRDGLPERALLEKLGGDEGAVRHLVDCVYLLVSDPDGGSRYYLSARGEEALPVTPRAREPRRGRHFRLALRSG